LGVIGSFKRPEIDTKERVVPEETKASV
jgi:hypothetical protein